MNIGLKHWRERHEAFVALVTHDVRVSYDDLRQMAHHCERLPHALAVVPVLRTLDGRVISAGGVMSRSGQVHHLQEVERAEPYAVAWGDGAVLVMAATAPEVPEQYFLYFEDVAHGRAIADVGGAVYCSPTESAYTSPGSSARREAFRYYYWRNRLAFARSMRDPLMTGLTVLSLTAAAAARSVEEVRGHRWAQARRLLRVYRSALVDGFTRATGPAPSSVHRDLVDV